MNDTDIDRDIDRLLRQFHARDRLHDTDAPTALRSAVLAIPTSVTGRDRHRSVRGITLLAAAALVTALAGGLFGGIGAPRNAPLPPKNAIVPPPGLADRPAWTSAGSLSVARPGHTATLLRDGRVLVIGGGPFLRSAEIWDPGTRSFSPAGETVHGRSGHAAMLLNDGRVLVAGGVGGPTPTREIEVWDPATATFSVAGALPQARGAGVSASLLAEGRVLITGGVDCPSDTAAADPCDGIDRRTSVWFDPDGRLTPGPQVLDERDSTAIALPDGGLLLVGLRGYRQPAHAEYLAPGADGFVAAGTTVESWRELTSASALADGRVLLVLAGMQTRVWDPATGFADAGSLSVTRDGLATATLPDGRVIIAGGRSGNPSLTSTEIWDPATSSFSAGPSMAVGRSSFTLTVLADGRVLAIGDGDDTGARGRSAEILE